MIRSGAGTKKCWKGVKLSNNKNIDSHSPHKHMLEDESKILLNLLMKLEAQLCAFFLWKNPV